MFYHVKPINLMLYFINVWISEIQSRLIKLIKNEMILSSYLELNKSKTDINKKMLEIQEIAKEISDDIENDKYAQKAKCCPTFLKLIRNYFF